MVRTLQITLTGAAQPVSATAIKCKWATFQNNAAAVMRIGDANVTAARGYSLATSGAFPVPVNEVATYGADLSQWFVFGTATQVLDVVYDDMNF